MIPIEIARTCNISNPFLRDEAMLCFECVAHFAGPAHGRPWWLRLRLWLRRRRLQRLRLRGLWRLRIWRPVLCAFTCAFLMILQNCCWCLVFRCLDPKKSMQATYNIQYHCNPVKSVKPLHWAGERSKGRTWCQQYCLFPHVLHQVVRTCTYPKTGCSCLAKIIWNFGVVSFLFCLLEMLCHPSYKDTRKESVCTHAGWNEGRYSTPTKTRGIPVRTFWKHINWMSTAIIAVPCRKAL